MCPLFRGSTVHKEEDNLSIVDKMADPNVFRGCTNTSRITSEQGKISVNGANLHYQM